MPQNTSTDTDKLKAENKRLKSLIRRLNEGSETWYNNLFDESNQALVVCDTFSDFPATILDCNANFRKLLSHSNREVIGKDFMELLRKGEKRKFFVQAFSNTNEKDIESLPLIFVDGVGKEVKLEISTKYFQSSRGRLALVSVQVENQHKSILRNGIEQLLSQSNQIFFGLKEDEILQFDYVSFSIYKVTGYSSDQLLLNPFLFWNNCHPEDLLLLKKALKSKKRYADNLSIRFIRQDGQMIWLDFSIISSPSTEDDDARYYAVARETTSQQKKERQMVKKDFYDQLILHTAKALIGHIDKDHLKSLVNFIGNQLTIERFSIYIHREAKKSLSFDYISELVSLDSKTYLSSNETTWNEFEKEFCNLPVIAYQSDDDNFNFKQEHISFFNRIKVKSALIVPLIYQGDTFGFVGSSTLNKHQRWDRTDINYLLQLSQLLSQAFHPKNLA